MRGTSLVISAICGGIAVGGGLFVWNYFNQPRVRENNCGTFEEVFVVDDVQLNASSRQAKKSYQKYAHAPPRYPVVPILILYGTEYGFSQEISKLLREELCKWNEENGPSIPFFPRNLDMEEFELIEWDKEDLVIVITSTYGDGVPPTRARKFFEFAEAQLNNPIMSHIQYSVLGLGDSSYPHFCRAGKTLDQLLESLGGHRILPRVDVDLENWNVINKWKEGVIKEIVNGKWKVREDADYLWNKISATNFGEMTKGYSIRRPYWATVVKKYWITQNTTSSEDEKHTLHIELELEEEDSLKYTVGDSVGIFPTNSTEEVKEVIDLLGIQAGQLVQKPSWMYIGDNDSSEGTVSIEFALLHCYDLKNIKPKLLQAIYDVLDQHGGSATKREYLAHILERGVVYQHQEYIAKRQVVDILLEFSELLQLMDVQTFLNYLGQLLPRHYSISSSPLTDPKVISITVVLVQYVTLEKKRHGVCTSFLNKVNVGQKIPIFINSNPDFRLPIDGNKDIIMIGPGTGIAPFRGMIRERVFTGANGKNILYFGCRYRDQDYLYKDELEEHQSLKQIELYTAFSRESTKKTYVQHLIKENAQHIWTLLQQGCHVYVCGDAKLMAPDVHNTLIEIVCNFGGMSTQEAEGYIKTMEKAKRYQRDIWF